MTDKELVQQEINKIEGYIQNNRSTGRTYKIANEIICKFWDEPMDTDIKIEDHDGGNNRDLAMLIKRRIETDFSSVQFRVYCMGGDAWFVVRLSQNFKENAIEHLNGWKERLAEMQDTE